MNISRYASVIIVNICALACTSCGPHMNVQPSVGAYKQSMPPMPAGTVPSEGRLVTVTAEQTAKTNPVPASSANITNGKIYYGYYCLMCHGEKGNGDGPVGQSYFPKPTDLTAASMAAVSDGDLYRLMLYGAGHEPVLDQTVIPSHRWHIVLYVRTLSGSNN